MAILRRTALAVAGLAVGWFLIRALTGIDLVADFAPALHRQVTFPLPPLLRVPAVRQRRRLPVVAVVNTGSIVASTVARWRERRPGMETVLWATLALTSISSFFKGETDHNWLFFMPLAIAVSASAVAEDELRKGSLRRASVSRPDRVSVLHGLVRPPRGPGAGASPK